MVCRRHLPLIGTMVIFFAAWLPSCTNKIMRQKCEKSLDIWRGRQIDEVISVWGEPNKTSITKEGGKIIEYVERSEMLITNDDCISVSKGPFWHHFYDDCEDSFPKKKSISVTTTRFFIDPNGIVNDWRWEFEEWKEPFP